MLWTYPKEYFSSQLQFYQYALTGNLQLAPDAVPVDEQPLPSLVHSATTPESLRTLPLPRGLRAGQVRGCCSHEAEIISS